MKVQRCKECKLWKKIEEYYKNSKSGKYETSCKSCKIKKQIERYNKLNITEEMRIHNKEYKRFWRKTEAGKESIKKTYEKFKKSPKYLIKLEKERKDYQKDYDCGVPLYKIFKQRKVI